ncbi:MAG: PA2169 family four-helix-bundle protein [Balneolaceae bacterium]
MQTNKELVKTTNDLIQINRDRIQGFKTAQEDIKEIDIDLHALFGQKIGQSEDFIRELEPVITKYGGELETDSSATGKLHRTWLDFKAKLTGKDREAILNSCAFGEKAAIDEYEDAMESSAEIPSDIRQLMMDQKEKIQSSLDSIEKYSEVHESVK